MRSHEAVSHPCRGLCKLSCIVVNSHIAIELPPSSLPSSQVHNLHGSQRHADAFGVAFLPGQEKCFGGVAHGTCSTAALLRQPCQTQRTIYGGLLPCLSQDIIFFADQQDPNHKVIASMKLLTVLTMQAGVLLSCLPVLPVNASAQSDQVHLGPDNEATTLDGPTSDQSASIGVEFKTLSVWFASPGCSVADTIQAGGKVVGNRKGDEWELTATTYDDSTLFASYTMDGAQIKIGDGTVTAAAAAVSNDIVRAGTFACSSYHLLINSSRWIGIHSWTWTIMNGTSMVMNAIHGKSRSPTEVTNRLLCYGRQK